jgi:hypothetical protein
VFVDTSKFNTRAVLDIDKVHPGVGFPVSGRVGFYFFGCGRGAHTNRDL